MYSRLDPIFKTQLRRTETLDTRQGIKRKEPLENKEKQSGEEDKDNEPDMWEDHTTVSVRTLIAFLKQLANETKNTDSASSNNENIGISKTATEKSKSADRNTIKNNAARNASQAYQRTYQATHTEEQKVPQSAIPSINLRPEEIRIIHTLIKDLDTLATKNIEQLTLRKSDSFLQSIVDAVHKEK